MRASCQKNCFASITYVLCFCVGYELFIICFQWCNPFFEHSPSLASEIEHFEIFSHPQESQLTQRFFVKFNLSLFFLILYC